MALLICTACQALSQPGKTIIGFVTYSGTACPLAR